VQKNALIRNGIIIGVIVVIAIAARVFLPTDANSLQVGQCFDPPTIEGEVNGVDDGPCTDPHKAEVFFVGDYAPTTDLFPTTTDFQDFYQSTCKPAFNTYTGLDYDTDTTYDLAAFRPTSESWSNGDRKVICYAIRGDEAPLSQSIKKS
jgi:hypothetical protein